MVRDVGCVGVVDGEGGRGGEVGEIKGGGERRASETGEKGGRKSKEETGIGIGIGRFLG